MERYRKGRRLGTVLLLSGAAMTFVGAFMQADFPALYRVFFVGGFIVLGAGVVAAVTLCRCPFCGHSIVVGALTRKNCPHCGHSLVSSLEKKKKK